MLDLLGVVPLHQSNHPPNHRPTQAMDTVQNVKRDPTMVRIEGLFTQVLNIILKVKS
jgi:hypothetical protein